MVTMEYKRYKFVDWNGNQCGIENTDDLTKAIQPAIDYQCEVIDTQTPIGNQIVFSVWDGWSYDCEFYNEKEMRRIMREIA